MEQEGNGEKRMIDFGQWDSIDSRFLYDLALLSFHGRRHVVVVASSILRVVFSLRGFLKETLIGRNERVCRSFVTRPCIYFHGTRCDGITGTWWAIVAKRSLAQGFNRLHANGPQIRQYRFVRYKSLYR